MYLSSCSAPGNSIGALSVTKDHIKARPQQLKNCEGSQREQRTVTSWALYSTVINTPTPVVAVRGMFTVVILTYYWGCWNESKEFKGCWNRFSSWSPRTQAEKELPWYVKPLLHPIPHLCLWEMIQLSIWCLIIQASRSGINLKGFYGRKW